MTNCPSTALLQSHCLFQEHFSIGDAWGLCQCGLLHELPLAKGKRLLQSVFMSSSSLHWVSAQVVYLSVLPRSKTRESSPQKRLLLNRFALLDMCRGSAHWLSLGQKQGWLKAGVERMEVREGVELLEAPYRGNTSRPLLHHRNPTRHKTITAYKNSIYSLFLWLCPVGWFQYLLSFHSHIL